MKKITPAAKHKLIKILVFFTVLLIFSVFMLIIPLRPEVSVTEKRELAKFPEFSWEALADGSYFSDIAVWFSDTVPFRDSLTALNAKLQNFLGASGVLAGFNEGEKGDDIPEPVKPSEIATIPDTTKSGDQKGEENVTFEDKKDPGKVEKLSSILICDNAGHEYYNFVQSTADTYAAAINTIAARVMPAGVNVYQMIVPTSADITLNTKVRSKINVSDQRAAIDYMYGSISDDVHKINVFDALARRRDEYIYFRTDHHWTALGAYYAYRELMGAMNGKCLELSEYEEGSFEGFLGSFYNDSGQNPALSSPDTVYFYRPPCSTTVTITDAAGKTFEGKLFYDETNAQPSFKYSTFITGDNPFTVVKNNDLSEGKSCVVVKESFGNCFVPFLTTHYKTVYVIDYRYYSGSISKFCIENKIDDLIILNNISMTRSENNVGKLTDKI